MKNKNKFMDEVKDLLVALHARLDAMDSRLTAIEQSTRNMDRHVGFVESLYETVQQPFNRLMNAVRYTPSLPDLSGNTETRPLQFSQFEG